MKKTYSFASSHYIKRVTKLPDVCTSMIDHSMHVRNTVPCNTNYSGPVRCSFWAASFIVGWTVAATTKAAAAASFFRYSIWLFIKARWDIRASYCRNTWFDSDPLLTHRGVPVSKACRVSVVGGPDAHGGLLKTKRASGEEQRDLTLSTIIIWCGIFLRFH